MKIVMKWHKLLAENVEVVFVCDMCVTPLEYKQVFDLKDTLWWYEFHTLQKQGWCIDWIAAGGSNGLCIELVERKHLMWL